MEQIIIRDWIPSDDFAFVIDSWLRSYYGHSSFSDYIPKHIFFKNHAEIVKDLLSKSETRLAVKSDDPSIIVGYICFETKKNTVHYIYVKEPFRHFGICRHMLEEYGLADGANVSHLTQKGRKIQLKMGYVYNPYF